MRPYWTPGRMTLLNAWSERERAYVTRVVIAISPEDFRAWAKARRFPAVREGFLGAMDDARRILWVYTSAQNWIAWASGRNLDSILWADIPVFCLGGTVEITMGAKLMLPVSVWGRTERHVRPQAYRQRRLSKKAG